MAVHVGEEKPSPANVGVEDGLWEAGCQCEGWKKVGRVLPTRGEPLGEPAERTRRPRSCTHTDMDMDRAH